MPAAIALAATDVSAHRRDELLQAARIAIEPERVALELDLTPGITIADAFIANLDHDRDGLLSLEEQQAYVTSVLAALELQVDRQALRMTPIASTFPALDTFRSGEGTIRVRYAADLPPLTSSTHALSFRNRHRADVGVYLANALVPESDRVDINAQHRDREQRDLTIDYTLRAATPPLRLWLVTVVASAALLMLRLRSPRRCALSA
jgi:hypothetical protein